MEGTPNGENVSKSRPRFPTDLRPIYGNAVRSRIKTIYGGNMIFTIGQERSVSDRYQ